jgi:hypothetical protein
MKRSAAASLLKSFRMRNEVVDGLLFQVRRTLGGVMPVWNAG